MKMYLSLQKVASILDFRSRPKKIRLIQGLQIYNIGVPIGSPVNPCVIFLVRWVVLEPSRITIPRTEGQERDIFQYSSPSIPSFSDNIVRPYLGGFDLTAVHAAAIESRQSNNTSSPSFNRPVFNGSSMDMEDASWYDDPSVVCSSLNVDHLVAGHASSNNSNAAHSSGYSSNPLQQNDPTSSRTLVRLNSCQAVERYIECMGDEELP